MIALVFTALPTKGEVYYTGTVQTMDDTGMLKDSFFRGERIYVNVTLWYQSALVDADINVQLYDPDGTPRSLIDAETNDPAVGYFNSTESVPEAWLSTNNVDIDGDVGVCDVVLTALTLHGWIEVVREQILLREERVTLDPDPAAPYFPGQDVTVTVTTASDEEFFVEVLDPDMHDLVAAQTFQEADENGEWSWTFEIPDGARDGWYTVNVRNEDTDDYLWDDWWSTSVAYFYIEKYRLEMYTDRDVVLPGEDVEVEYIVYDLSTLSLYMDVTTEWTATWYNLTGDDQIDTGELVPSYNGTEIFTIPTDINMSSDYQIHFWVNDTADRTSEAWLTFSMGRLGGDVWTDDSVYLAGMVVTVQVEAWVEYEWSSSDWDDLPGADVDIVVEKDGVELAIYGETDMTTGAYGEVEHDFTLADDAGLGTYLVTATISKLDYSIVRMTTFEVEFEYDFEVSLDKDTYYSGETATAAFTTWWGPQKVTDNTVFYIVYSGVGDLMSGSTTTGEVEFQIPLDFVGNLWVYGVTSVESYTMEDWDSASVQKAYIALAPLVEEYSGGDTVQWEYVIMTMMIDGQLSYEIWSSDGEMMASTTIAFSDSGTISYTVPVDDPASWYAVVVTLKDGMGNSVSAVSYVYLVSMYDITAWIDNDSGFVSRAFEPGDTIRIGYEITTNGVAHRSVYKIEYYTSADWVSLYVITESTTGTLTLTVPEGATDGDYDIYVDLRDGVTNAYLAGDWLQYGVLTGQSGWDKEIAGMSAIDFTILVLIIVMIVLLIVVPFLKGKEFKVFKPKEPAPMTSMPPEAPPPTPPSE